LVFAYLFTLAITITPPGVCPCWLMLDPGAHHPHFDGHPEIPHQHEYLFEYFQSQTVVPPPIASIPVALLIALQAASGLLSQIAAESLLRLGWVRAPLTPPPRPPKNLTLTFGLSLSHLY
jgi:hypothetical protein